MIKEPLHLKARVDEPALRENYLNLFWLCVELKINKLKLSINDFVEKKKSKKPGEKLIFFKKSWKNLEKIQEKLIMSKYPGEK